MNANRVVHVHIPGDFQGEIHLYVGPAGVEMTPAGSNGSASTEASPVERILERLERRDPSSAARHVCETLVARGWDAHAPINRNGDASTIPYPYIRLVYKGSHHTVSVFLNTKSLQYARRNAHRLVDHISDSELHGDGTMYLYHSAGRANTAVEGMAFLERWANGDVDAGDAS